MAGWVDSPFKMKEGMEYFYGKSGVRPFVLILDQDNSATMINANDAQRQELAEAAYNNYFTDQAHVLFIISEHGEDFRYDEWIGGEAYSVTDDIVVNQIYDAFDYYWKTDATTEEVFTNSFKDVANSIK